MNMTDLELNKAIAKVLKCAKEYPHFNVLAAIKSGYIWKILSAKQKKAVIQKKGVNWTY